MELVYKRAAEVLEKLQRRKGSLKSLVFSKKLNGPVSFRKQVYAVAAETLKCKTVLLSIIEASQLLDKEPELTINLALVLTHDLLFGKGVKCRDPLKQYVVKHEAELKQYQKALAKDQQRKSDTSQIPRYVRINLLKTSVCEVVTRMKLDGYIQEELNHHDMVTEERVFSIDHHLSDVLVFHSSVTLTSHPLYHNSHIILQDKASCLAAYLLAPPPGSNVIDCCAAPGNKTTHLASLMNNHGRIHAFDKDPERFAVLKNRLKQAGATCVSPLHCDFLQVNTDDYHDTEYILVDPSCSGSGIANRLDYHDFEVSTHRLKRLSSFQLRMLKHALEFPLVKKVVYSTCSVHKEENEMVVQRALQQFQSSFILEHAMPEWTGRGLPMFDGGERCLRASPQGSATNGFFIAVFLRKDLDSKKAYRPGIPNTQQHTMIHTDIHMIPAKLKKGSKKGWKRKQKSPVTSK